jgi:hypothetical protein
LLRVKECGYSQEKDVRDVAVTKVFIAKIIPVGTRLEVERSFKELGTFWTNVPYSVPFPRRFPISYVNIEEQPQLVAIFKNWRINPALEEKIFSFVPPTGSKEVEIKKAPGSTRVK